MARPTISARQWTGFEEATGTVIGPEEVMKTKTTSRSSGDPDSHKHHLGIV